MSPEQIEKNMRAHLSKLLPEHSLSAIYEYATLPGGKLFRPGLVWSVLKDLNLSLYNESVKNLYSPHSLLASAIEFHHSYTLVHDDLPSMDNDDERRGKPATHKAWGEWQALLAGDGLLNLSYQLLAKSNHPRTLEVIRFFAWACGPKGLIHGQVLDLSQEMTKSFENTLRTHELKTARLIQSAIVGSALISDKTNRILEKKLYRYSRLLGINFQLIDDLSELNVAVLSEHELDVNPWLHFTPKTLTETIKGLQAFNSLSEELALFETNAMVSRYYQKMLAAIAGHEETINSHLKEKINLAPVVLLLDSFNSKK